MGFFLLKISAKKKDVVTNWINVTPGYITIKSMIYAVFEREDLSADQCKQKICTVYQQSEVKLQR